MITTMLAARLQTPGNFTIFEGIEGVSGQDTSTRLAGDIRLSHFPFGAGPSRAEIHSHLPCQGYHVATLLISDPRSRGSAQAEARCYS